ncbi:MAG: hypothetical protein O2960_21595 [Verrucomicrobia bacterium]|nr:hypothetical protein [Verrucomicrobiota bacterium]
MNGLEKWKKRIENLRYEQRHPKPLEKSEMRTFCERNDAETTDVQIVPRGGAVYEQRWAAFSANSNRFEFVDGFEVSPQGVLEPVLKMERGCVEDQPQHIKRFQTLDVLWVAAAGRGRHRAPGFQNTLLELRIRVSPGVFFRSQPFHNRFGITHFACEGVEELEDHLGMREGDPSFVAPADRVPTHIARDETGSNPVY